MTTEDFRDNQDAYPPKMNHQELRALGALIGLSAGLVLACGAMIVETNITNSPQENTTTQDLIVPTTFERLELFGGLILINTLAGTALGDKWNKNTN